MRAKKIFVINTVILTLTALILRGIGLFFRVYLSNIIGAEGIGLYQLIFSMYMLVSTFATSGISTAVTRLCADEMVVGNKESVLKVLKRAVQLSALLGVIINALVYSLSSPIASALIGDVRATSSLKILSFSLVPMGVSSCFKGYFMARRNTALPSIASIVEQIARIMIVMSLLATLKSKDIETACFYVLLSDTLAEIISCVFIYISAVRDKAKLQINNANGTKKTKVLSSILKIATPITAGRYLTSALRTTENLIVPKCLSAFSSDRLSGIETFGLLKGMAMPIIFFPSSFLQAISMLLIPEISESVALGKNKTIKNDVKRVISITVVGSIFVGGCFHLCSRQIGMALYGSEEVGVLINVLAPLVPIMYLESVVDGILKGLNKQTATFIYNTIDSSLRIILILVFVTRFGMDGFLGVMVFSNIFTCVLNLIKLLKTIMLRFDIKNWIIKPLAAIIIAMCFAKQLCVSIENNIAYIIVSVTICFLVYFVIVLISGAVSAITIKNAK